MKPAKEQESIIEAARQDRNIAINAFAGTGKTTTLSMIAQALPRKRILYLAFNKAIAEEAKRRMPSNVDARTFHSLAFRAMRPDMKRLEGRLHGGFVADLFGRPLLNINKFPFYQNQIGRAVLETVTKFCMDKERIIKVQHIPLPHEMFPHPSSIPDSIKNIVNRPSSDVEDYKRIVKVNAENRWQRMNEWRGAINALDFFEVDESLYLTESWRFHHAIADRANIVLKALGETNPLIGRGGTCTNSGQAFLCRTNFGALDIYVDLIEQHDDVRLANAEDLISLIDDCESLINGHGPIALPKSATNARYKS
jgi:hypothetical protein